MPFYFKKDGTWTKLEAPTDIRDDKGKLLVSVYPSREDPEQLTFHVCDNRDIVLTTERKDRFFPGQEGFVNRDDIFIADLDTGKIMAVIHSEKPIND